MESPLRKVIMFGSIHQWDKQGQAKSCITHGPPLQGCQKLSDTNYRIEQVQGRRRHRKVAHFDRLKLCPKNICLDNELTSEQHTSSWELISSTEKSLPIGHDLEIAYNDDDEADDATATTPHTPMDTTSQPELATPAGRYTR